MPWLLQHQASYYMRKSCSAFRLSTASGRMSEWWFTAYLNSSSKDIRTMIPVRDRVFPKWVKTQSMVNEYKGVDEITTKMEIFETLKTQLGLLLLLQSNVIKLHKADGNTQPATITLQLKRLPHLSTARRERCVSCLEFRHIMRKCDVYFVSKMRRWRWHCQRLSWESQMAAFQRNSE